VVQPALTIVIPTRNEAGNVVPLLGRMGSVALCLQAEVVFVDDSSDHTPELIAQAAANLPFPVRVIHREVGEQIGGLGGAVVVGMQHAAASRVAVLDGDLQHPPELLVEMLDEMLRTGADVVVATRYRAHGSADGLSPLRTLVSKAATRLAHLLLPAALGRVSDPMSGFFVVNLGAIRLDQLRPNGFKILVDILGRTPSLRVAEVPFSFDLRHSGASKGSSREFIRYLQVLVNLRREHRPIPRIADDWGRRAFAGDMAVSSPQDAC
jgi:dolichol-phosphate mannosyltransferase